MTPPARPAKSIKNLSIYVTSPAKGFLMIIIVMNANTKYGAATQAAAGANVIIRSGDRKYDHG